MSGPHPPPEVLEADELPETARAHLEVCPACRVDRRLLRAPMPSTPSPGWERARALLEAGRGEGIGRALESWSSGRGEEPAGEGPPPLEPGAFAQDWQVEQPLGRGGMAVVYVVRHRDTGVRRALKVLRSDRSTGRRLAREGRLQAALRHPNVVEVHDVIEVGGAPALVLALIDGGPLDRLLQRGPLPIGVVDAIATDVLAGLAAAHAAGLVHRDVKPSNVLLSLDGPGVRALLGDFGLAKSVAPVDSVSTQVGAVVGTLAYMAPEQLRDARAADARSDVYSAGALLRELLTGVRPTVAAGPPPELPSTVPERMRRAVEAATRADPAARPPDAGALLAVWRRDADPPPPWPADLVAAVAALRPRPPADPVFDGGTGRRRSVSLPPDPLIGRRAELEAVRAALREGPGPVTLLGPPGSGKSRLARQLARQVLGEAVWVCDLLGAEGPDDLARVVADALGGSAAGPDPVGAVGALVATRGRCLVVLDGFDAVGPGGIAALDAWRRAAPDARWVATATRALGLDGERRVPVPPLAIDDGVALFRRRWARAGGEGEPAEVDRRVRELVDLVDGIPAAIEVVAARAAVVSLDRLRERLATGTVRVVDGGRSAGLRAAIEAAWGGLSAAEQRLLARLSVFEGPFREGDAAEVVGDDGPGAAALLESLHERSLVRLIPDDGQDLRFGLFRGVREIAREHLGDGLEAAERAHAEHFARRAAALEETPRDEDAWRRMRADLVDARAAVRRALARGWVATAAEAWCGLYLAIERTGPVGDTLELGARVLDEPELPPALDPRVRSRLVDAWVALGDFSRCESLLLAARPRTEADRGVVDLQLGNVRQHQGRLGEARALLERAVERLERVGDPLLVGNALRVLGTVLGEQMAFPEAIAVAGRALARYAEAGDALRSAYVRINLAADLGELGRIDEAESELLAALPVVEAHGDERRLVSVLRNLGQVALARGELARALDRFSAAAATARSHGFLGLAASVELPRSHVLVLLGRAAEAAEVAGAAANSLRGRGHDALRAQLRNNEGAALVRLGRMTEAAVVLRQALAGSEEPGRFTAYVHHELGRVLAATGDVAGARAELEAAIRVGAVHTVATSRARMMAEVLSDLADLGDPPAEVLARFDALGLADPGPCGAHDAVCAAAVRARLLAESGRRDEASAVLAALGEAAAPDGSIAADLVARARRALG